MDEDMEGKTHAERERERIRSGLVQLSLDNNNNNNERERERDIEHPKESGVGSRSHHPPHPPWGRPPSWRTGSEKTQYLTLY